VRQNSIQTCNSSHWSVLFQSQFYIY